jgi:DNA-binding MarR family transcriptional regulator
MMQEGLVEKYRSQHNSKNIFYSITDKGIENLKKYKDRMESQANFNCGDQVELSNNINTIINILKGKKND